MILLIWTSDRAQDCAHFIERTLATPVRVLSNLQQACEHLQKEDYSAVLIDQWILESEPGEADYLFHHLGTAIPLPVNFGISGMDRIVRELRAALNRRSRETTLARHNARIALHHHLKDDVTALLLCCGMALNDPGLAESAVARLRTIAELANRIKEKLAASDEDCTAMQDSVAVADEKAQSVTA